jgi:hypothetical protein
LTELFTAWTGLSLADRGDLDSPEWSGLDVAALAADLAAEPGDVSISPNEAADAGWAEVASRLFAELPAPLSATAMAKPVWAAEAPAAVPEANSPTPAETDGGRPTEIDPDRLYSLIVGGGAGGDSIGISSPALGTAVAPVRPAELRESTPPATRSWARRCLGAAVVVLALVVGVAVAAWLWPAATAVPAGPLPAADFSVAPAAAELDTVESDAMAAAAATDGRNWLMIPSLGVDAPIDAVDFSRGSLYPPDDAGRVGLWTRGGGLAAGSEAGTALVVGHVQTRSMPEGALYRLADVEPGAVVVTTDGAGTPSVWVVTELRTEPKTASHPDLFQMDGPRRLAIVTCGGAGQQFNVIAIAVPAERN